VSNAANAGSTRSFLLGSKPGSLSRGETNSGESKRALGPRLLLVDFSYSDLDRQQKDPLRGLCFSRVSLNFLWHEVLSEIFAVGQIARSVD
jgi:ABC-type uncharacterized transport system YnjBCD ATPase subunit